MNVNKIELISIINKLNLNQNDRNKLAEAIVQGTTSPTPIVENNILKFK